MQKEFEAQKEWGWNIAVYLFLAGVGAGGYVTGVICDLVGGESWKPICKIGISMGFPLVFIGTLFLIADLGVKPRALYVFLNPATSWIARGTYIITIFMLLGAAHIAFWIWPLDLLEEFFCWRGTLGCVNLVFAILTMVYTGVLLGASRPIALWSTPLLPVLFLISALSTGIAGTILLSAIYAHGSDLLIEAELGILTRFDAFLIITELIVIGFYLQAMHRTDESRASLAMLIKGKLSLEFWGGFIIFGLSIPLVSELAEIIFLSDAELVEMFCTILISTILSLLGGLLLRHLILAAGVKASLRAGGFEFKLPPKGG
jgi:formate-dependent nitrite reductase membrane component NrfD